MPDCTAFLILLYDAMVSVAVIRKGRVEASILILTPIMPIIKMNSSNTPMQPMPMKVKVLPGCF